MRDHSRSLRQTEDMIDISQKKKVGLVLSGGGIKAAAFHIGVCLALREKGFRFAGGTKDEVKEYFDLDDPKTIQLYVGSSAGSVISTFLAAGFSLESITEAFVQGQSSDLSKFKKARHSVYDKKLRPISYRDIFSVNGSNIMGFIPSMIKRRSIVSGGLEVLIKNGFKINGLFTARGVERYLRQQLFELNQFSAFGVELFIVATQLNHSRKVIFGPYTETTKEKTVKRANFASVSDAVAASASLPPVFAPYPIHNQKGKELFFFDGEIRDTLSTHVASDHGADLVISSYSVQPYHYSKKFGSLHEYGIPAIINQALYQVIEKKIERHRDFNDKISKIYSGVEAYCKREGFTPETRDQILKIICEQAEYKVGVDHIYIHPHPRDHEMFFADHFSLNPERLARIVQIGFRSALTHLRQAGL